MSYRARFSESPAQDDPRGYEEIAKGVFQIWRFVSHHRRGLVGGGEVSLKLTGIVLTLDNWLSMAEPIQDDVLAIAVKMAAARDSEITEGDRIPILFCPIADLEATLETATPSSFLNAVRAAAFEPYKGWMLQNVHRDLEPTSRRENVYPFADRIGAVLPWWDRLTTLRKSLDRA